MLSADVGAIVGGVIGGLIGVVLLILLVLLVLLLVYCFVIKPQQGKSVTYIITNKPRGGLKLVISDTREIVISAT